MLLILQIVLPLSKKIEYEALEPGFGLALRRRVEWCYYDLRVREIADVKLRWVALLHPLDALVSGQVNFVERHRVYSEAAGFAGGGGPLALLCILAGGKNSWLGRLHRAQP